MKKSIKQPGDDEKGHLRSLPLFTPDEDKLLMKLTNKKHIDWNLISQSFLGKKASDLKQRYEKLREHQLKKDLES